jgi:hypothetical protein
MGTDDFFGSHPDAVWFWLKNGDWNLSKTRRLRLTTDEPLPREA